MASARDAQRALLDALLGEERDKPPEEQTGPVHFSDPSIDKQLLLGCSPRELLKGTRYAPAAPIVPFNPPSEVQIREWNSLTQAQKDEYGYEYELLHVLRRLVRECDQRIHTLEARLAREEADKSVETVARDASAILYTEDAYNLLLNRVKVLIQEGVMSEALKVGGDLKAIEDQRNAIMLVNANPPKSVVCPISGNLMALIDTDERIMAHYEGRAYVGWTAIRKKLAELEKINPPPPRKRSPSSHDRHSSSRRRSSSRRDDSSRNRRSPSPRRYGSRGGRSRDRRDSRRR